MQNFVTLIFICASLLIFFTDSIAPQDPNVQPSCNNCCQGPIGPQGTPGIPGVPGTNGLAGGVGPKGESGLRGESIQGDRGEKGDTGNPGKKGSRGKQGKGSKGEKGEKGDQTPLSAFSSARSTPFTPSSANQGIPFEHVYTNLGEDFEVAAGRFTCEIPGVYLFTYSIAYSESNPYVYLMKNEVHINGLYRSVHRGQWDVSTNSAVLQLAAGDRVWLKCLNGGSEVFSNEHRFTTFSGVLLHEV